MTHDDYQQAMRELARGATMPDGSAAKLEGTLREALESSAPRAGETAEGAARHAIAFGRLAAAAALMLAAGGAAWYLGRATVTSNNVTTAPPTMIRADLRVGATDDADLKVATANDAKPMVGISGGAGPKGSASEARARRPRKLPAVVRPQGFVAVPAAAGLPQFESGVIVRLSLPLALLPAYGVDISPASTDQPVEADVLLGQDGRARAIRLVNTSRSQQ